MEVSGQIHALVHLPPRKHPPKPTGQETGLAQSRSGRREEEKNLAPAGNPTPAVQPVARRYRVSNLYWE
jgi:hypothetical protein